jgi:predicted nucleotidyltransferase
MDKATVLIVVDRFRVALERRGVRVQRIVLFGSQAAGNASAHSDIDLVVISPDFADRNLWARIQMLSEAICDVWSPIEAVGKTQREWDEEDSPVTQFARQGVVVYQAA